MESAEVPAEAPALTTLFTSLAEESADSIVVVFHDGSIRYMNPMAGSVTGLDPVESRGSSIFELVHPDDVARAMFDPGGSLRAGRSSRLVDLPGEVGRWVMAAHAGDDG